MCFARSKQQTLQFIPNKFNNLLLQLITTLIQNSRQGLKGASLRAIALELDCTTGVLTHYFRNKDELLLFVLETIMTRLSEIMVKEAQGTQGLARLKVMMLAILPVKP